jgi:hypothetical protein
MKLALEWHDSGAEVREDFIEMIGALAAPVQEPLTTEQREEIYAKSDLAMRASENLLWRDAIVNYVEAAHGITKGAP